MKKLEFVMTITNENACEHVVGCLWELSGLLFHLSVCFTKEHVFNYCMTCTPLRWDQGLTGSMD